MMDQRPGLNPARLVNLMRAAIERCRLDLSGLVVLTEAASGAYSVTPVLAGMAGAKRVYALTRSTRHGSVEEISAQTAELARLAGVGERVEVITAAEEAIIAQADVVTNSGHLRPIDAAMIGKMKSGAVIPLMYEAWEYRPGDVDLAAAAERGIPVVGTNERHPAVDVFSFLGLMAVKQLLDAGVAAYGSSILLLCDNPFRPFIERGLRAGGATVETWPSLYGEAPVSGEKDAILVALHPADRPVLGAREARLIAERWPSAVVAQYWGDIDRSALAAVGLQCWPREAPPAGHMGVLPSAVGPEPIVRLQAGGLKAAEVAWRGQTDPAAQEFVDVL